MAESNATKLCECGCGEPAPLAKWTDKRFGHVKGQPVRFIRGHSARAGIGGFQVVHGDCRDGVKSKEYRTWASMINRCVDPKNKCYKDYGGRGIEVCESWLDFKNFLKDMGSKPRGTSLDRIDNDGNYSPSNCRWATGRIQASNKRTNDIVTAFGEEKTLTSWSRDVRCCVSYDTLRSRIRKCGWLPEDAILKPADKSAGQFKPRQ